MHISDGILSAPVVVGGFVAAGAMGAVGAAKMRDEEIPRVAVFTAVFFAASLIHVKVPPTSVHLLLHGLLGVVLGWRALLAIPVGLALQAALLGHGGFTTVGVNACILAPPALAAWFLYGALVRLVGGRHFIAGALSGASAVLLSGVLLMGFLLATGEGFRVVAQFALLAHLPILIVEGLITGLAMEFLHRVQPTLLEVQRC